MQFKRHEIKYYVNNIQLEGLIRKLSSIMQLDKHAVDSNGYRVRSLYFDSISDECLYEKQSGFQYRNKFRLRTYDDRKIAKFEIKRKHGQLVKKDSVIVSKEDAEKVCAGDFGVLLDYEDPILNEIYATFSSRVYRPKVMVEYERIALVMPVSNIRITFDLNLRSNINQLDLFSPIQDLMPVILEGKQILEIKFDEFLPGYIKRVLSGIAAERSAISKYTLARRFHKIQKWEDN